MIHYLSCLISSSYVDVVALQLSSHYQNMTEKSVVLKITNSDCFMLSLSLKTSGCLETEEIVLKVSLA